MMTTLAALRIKELEERIAELEAERDETRAKLDVSETFEEHNKVELAQSRKRERVLREALEFTRDTAVALIDVNNQKLNSVLTIEAPKRIRDRACAALAAGKEGQAS